MKSKNADNDQDTVAQSVSGPRWSLDRGERAPGSCGGAGGTNGRRGARRAVRADGDRLECVRRGHELQRLSLDHVPGGEGTTPIGSTTSPSFTDAGLTNGPPTLYYYKVAAVKGGTVSPQSAETVSPTPPRTSPGTGTVAGVSGNGGLVFYGKDGLGGGFDWFNATASQCTNCPDWFPQWLSAQAGALAPGGAVVDMAYADEATLTFSDVVVPSAGLYNIDFRYAFGPGLFPLVTNREMGLLVNGTKKKMLCFVQCLHRYPSSPDA